MEPFAPILVLLIIVLLLVGPILAIVAFARVSSLQKSIGQIPQILSRIYALEERLKAIDRRLASFGAVSIFEAPAEPRGTTAAPATPPKPIEAVRPAAPHVSPTRPAAAVPPSGGAATPPPFARPAQPPSPPAPPRFTAPISTPPNGGEGDVESTIAGRWFNYVGILAVALAVAFFLKYAFDNDWIGPAGRVTLGLIVGAAMYPFSHWVLRRGYRYYSEGLAGLGAAILYLSIWSGWHYYHLFPQSYAFPLMIVVTAMTVAVAVGRNSQRVAVLALIGGLLTPILVSTGENAEVTLFGYLLVLGGAMLGIAWVRKWRSLAPVQFVGTLIYFWGWYSEFYFKTELDTTVFFATAFFALFAALPAVRSTRAGQLPAEDIAVVLTNAFNYLIALRLMLLPDYRWALTLTVLALAAAHLFAERALPRKPTDANRLAHMLYAGLALTFATLAIPIRLEGKWITIAFAVEGALLIWSGLRVRALALRVAGLVLFAVVGFRLALLVLIARTPTTFLLNERFLTLAVCAACWLAAYFFAEHSDCQPGAAETQLYFFLELAANFVFVLALSMDVWDLFGRMPSLGIDRGLAQQLALSLLWVAYAVVLLIVGMIRKSASVRWQGLTLLCAAIVKACFVDLLFLTRFYRIISFFILGLVLLVVSFFYQKRSKARPA
jgi:uncharacterized membrane protein